MNTLWTPEQAALFMQVSPASLAHYRKRGGGPPFIKLGRQVRYVPSEVAKWLARATHDRTKGAPEKVFDVGIIS